MAEAQQSQSHIKLPQSIPDTAHHSTLTTEVLPIFDVRRWIAVGDQEYHAMVPALRLASLFLTEPRIASFWHTLYFGARTRELEVTGKWITRIRKPVPWTKEGETKFKGVLNDMATRVSYRFMAMRGSYGRCRRRKGGKYRVRLNEDFSLAARAIKSRQSRAEGFPLRFNLMFAVTLVHEIAHAIDFSFAGHYPCGIPSEEALHGERKLGHSGFVWEREVFGGAMLSFGDSLNGEGGIALQRDFFDNEPSPGGPKICIEMAKIWMLQQKGFWHDPDLRFDLHEMLRAETSISEINKIFAKQSVMDFRERGSLKRKRPVAQHGTEEPVRKPLRFVPVRRRLDGGLAGRKQDDVLEDVEMGDVEAGQK